MVSLYQEFEFVYPDGELFYDRAGALSRRLKELFPGLQAKPAEYDQRQFTLAFPSLNLLFGVAVSRATSVAVDDKEFAARAATFFKEVCDQFELNELNRFTYKQIVGRPCSTPEEAQELMWPLVPEEQKTKLANVAPLPAWKALQAEMIQGAFLILTRTEVMNLIPAPDLDVGGRLWKKMANIIFPQVQFAGASPEEAIEFLRIKSRDYDPDNPGGVELFYDTSLPSTAQINLDLKDCPMTETLKYIVDLAGLRFKLAPDRVLIVDGSDNGTLPHITFHSHTTGQAPIPVADLDVTKFIRYVRDQHSTELLKQLAPHLS
jgi:hypothetical protein